MSHLEDNKRLAKNTFALYLRTAIVLFVQLFVTRIILRALGEEDFGIYNVVGSVIVLFSFLNTSMSAASQRYITFELGKNNDINTSKVFSSSLVTQSVIAFIFFVIVEIIGIYLINFKLSIPNDRLTAANIAFQFSILTFCIQTIRVPFDASVIAHEKMTFFAYASIFEAFIKLGIALLLFNSSADRLVLYALLIASNSILLFIVYLIYCKRKFNTCQFVFNKDKNTYKSLITYSGWSILGSSTNVITQQGFVFLINIFYGVCVNAALGIANQVNGAIASFMGSFMTSYRPQMVKSYANNDTEHLHKLIGTTSKMSFVMMVIPIAILIFNMQLVLNLWLGTPPNYAVQFCQIILICSLIDTISSPFNSAIMATEKINKYQISISLSFVLDLLLSFMLIKIGVTPYVVLLSRIATRGVLNLFIGLAYLNKLLNYNSINYIIKSLLPILILVILLGCMFKILNCIDSMWLKFLVSSLSIVSLSLPYALFIILSKDERIYLLSLLKRTK